MEKIIIDCTGWGFSEVRGLVLLRDKGKCVKCGNKIRVEVHHINGRKDNRVSSLETLCGKCHAKKHTGDKLLRMPFIKKLMIRKNIFQGELVPILGISQSAVSQMLKKGTWRILINAGIMTDFVNRRAGTKYTIEKMFTMIKK